MRLYARRFAKLVVLMLLLCNLSGYTAFATESAEASAEEALFTIRITITILLVLVGMGVFIYTKKGKIKELREHLRLKELKKMIHKHHSKK